MVISQQDTGGGWFEGGGFFNQYGDKFLSGF
jgi:hypothetical protein